MLDFGTDTPKLRLILSGFRGQLAPFITVHSPDSTKSGRCPYLAAKFAGTPRFMGPIRANEGERGRKPASKQRDVPYIAAGFAIENKGGRSGAAKGREPENHYYIALPIIQLRPFLSVMTGIARSKDILQIKNIY